MSQGRSPFAADRNHIHHYFLELGLTHKQTTLVSVAINAAYIAFAFLMQDLGTTYLSILVFGSALVLTGGLYWMKKRKESMLRAVIVSTIHDVDQPSVAQPKILRVNPKGILQDK
jgi:hypothetical protein